MDIASNTILIETLRTKHKYMERSTKAALQ